LRILVLTSGCLLLVAGVGLVVSLPLPPAWRGMLLLLWLADTVAGLRGIHAGMLRLGSLTVNQFGEMSVTGPDGTLETVTLESGSVVLRRIAWLRLRFPDNSRYAEFFCGNPVNEPAWHRFQLIWQHAAEAFGR
jgi:hypothetical protein